MSIDSTIRVPNRLHALAATAMLLERLERAPRSASAGQYRGLVRQLGSLLAEADGDPALPALLSGLPALAELHENRHYAEAGLCRSPLDAAVSAEREVHALVDRLKQRH